MSSLGMTSALRLMLLQQGNKPMKISAVVDSLVAAEKFKGVSKAHVKRKIIHPMMLRDEVS
jgi:hypothetical protein